MKNILTIKGLLLSLSILFFTACSHAEENKDIGINKDKNTLNPIVRLSLLNKEQAKIDSDENLKFFIKGYKYLEAGNIYESKSIFTDLKKRKDKEAKEYGEYGFLLLASETDNMFNMKRCIQKIESLDNKSEWLIKELRNYRVVYNFKIADFNEVENILKMIDESDIVESPILTSIKAEIYIRKNKMNEAKRVLSNLKNENEESIAMNARIAYLNKGSKAAVDYLSKKIENNSDNDELQLIYNQYLIHIDQESAVNNSYRLGLKTKNSYILASSMQLLFPDADSKKTLEKINKLNDKLSNMNVAKDYIDYYLVGIYLSINSKEKSINMAVAKDFNPMNYTLLLQEYYSAFNKEEQLEVLGKLEVIDPYDHYILLELANFYKINSMNKELAEIKQRFSNSKRLKTKEQIEFMKTI